MTSQLDQEFDSDISQEFYSDIPSELDSDIPQEFDSDIPSNWYEALRKDKTRHESGHRNGYLLEAIWADANLAVIKKFVEYGRDVHTQHHENGWTALHVAVKMNKNDIVEYLLEKGVDVNAQVTDYDREELTPLHLANFNDCFDPASSLIQAGADVHLRDAEGKTALWRVVRQLVGFEWYLDRRTERQFGKDHIQRLKIVKELINAGASVDTASPDNSLLIAACFIEDMEILQLLVQQSANALALINAVSRGFSPLTAAIESALPETVKYLLQQGADPLLRFEYTTTDTKDTPRFGGIAVHKLCRQPHDEFYKQRVQILEQLLDTMSAK